MKPKSILAFDIDGTLTKRNTYDILPKNLPTVLNILSEKGHYCVPVTGKPAPYATRIIETNHLVDRGVIAENAEVFRIDGTLTINLNLGGLIACGDNPTTYSVSQYALCHFSFACLA